MADQKLEFRPRARIIRTIGDQLISGPEAAIIELVKNSYDADASYVWIRFVPPLHENEGRISVRDDGHGMTLSDVRDKWMEPATASKTGLRLSRLKQRPLMGSKGIGRFAAAKLGKKFGLNSVSDTDRGVREEVLIPEIDWSLFSGDAYLSDITIDYLLSPSSASTGTEIEIRQLNEAWSEAKLLRLNLELRRLVSPLGRRTTEDPFRIFLDLSECTVVTAGFDGAALLGVMTDTPGTQSSDGPPSAFEVQPFPLLTTSDYEVAGEFDPDGAFDGWMQIRRGGQGRLPLKFRVPLEPDERPCGTVSVQLYVYDREADAVKKTMTRAGLGDMSAAEARHVISEIAGVAIYRNGFRIRPYGDSENDWLTLDRRRVQDPSLRIGHNQVAGYVSVGDQEDSGLVERSSREGFEENGAFARLKHLIDKLFIEHVEPRRYTFREKAGLSRAKDITFEEVRQLANLDRIRALVRQLPPAEQAEALQVINAEAARLTDKIEVLEERQRVLEAKSSLGAIIAEVLHEGGPAAAFVVRTSNRLPQLFADALAGHERSIAAKQEFPERLALLKTSGQQLVELFSALKPLAGGKRKPPSYYYVATPISGAIALFESHKIHFEIHGGLEAPRLIGHPEDLMTAMVNLIGNAVHWLEETHVSDPRIDIRIQTRGSDLAIYVDDNGPGIPEEFAERIFDLGFSLKNGGTGLGLSIAREALARSDGALSYHLDFSPGSRFEIRFPIPPAKVQK